MSLIRLIAGIVLAFEMPVPVYWLMLHAPVKFWRKHVRAAYLLGIVVAWGLGDSLLYYFRAQLFRTASPPVWSVIAGLALLALDVLAFVAAEAALGGRRLVGQAELSGSGELLTRGLYTRVRHPRYLGMIAGVMGACLILGSRWLWTAGLLWLFTVLATIRLEERELRDRFGTAYAAYAQRVPALLPFRFRSGRGGPA